LKKKNYILHYIKKKNELQHSINAYNFFFLLIA